MNRQQDNKAMVSFVCGVTSAAGLCFVPLSVLSVPALVLGFKALGRSQDQGLAVMGILSGVVGAFVLVIVLGGMLLYGSVMSLGILSMLLG